MVNENNPIQMLEDASSYITSETNFEVSDYILLIDISVDPYKHLSPISVSGDDKGFLYSNNRFTASIRDDTLILVTTDHECGAMYYLYSTAAQATILDDIKFKSSNRSRARVRLDVYGDISEYVSKYQAEFLT